MRHIIKRVFQKSSYKCATLFSDGNRMISVSLFTVNREKNRLKLSPTSSWRIGADMYLESSRCRRTIKVGGSY